MITLLLIVFGTVLTVSMTCILSLLYQNDWDVREIYYLLTTGYWHVGYDTPVSWPNKKQVGVFYTYYDGPMAALHIWRFWVTVDYFSKDEE